MSRITILIADDESEIADLIELHLKKRVTTALRHAMARMPFMRFKRIRLIWLFWIL